MARFVLSSVDYDQMGGGVFPAVEELQRQLPVTAKLMRQIPGPDRPDYFVGRLDQPIKYHPVDGFDWGRSLPQFVAEDDAGRFVWIYAIIVASLMAGTQLHAGMKGFPVRVAYVIDHTLGRDAKLDFAKCDYISYGIISDPDEPAPPPPDIRQ